MNVKDEERRSFHKDWTPRLTWESCISSSGLAARKHNEIPQAVSRLRASSRCLDAAAMLTSEYEVIEGKHGESMRWVKVEISL